MPGDEDELTVARVKAMRKARKALLHGIRNKLHVVSAGITYLQKDHDSAEAARALADMDDACVKLVEKFLALEELL